MDFMNLAAAWADVSEELDGSKTIINNYRIMFYTGAAAILRCQKNISTLHESEEARLILLGALVDEAKAFLTPKD